MAKLNWVGIGKLPLVINDTTIGMIGPITIREADKREPIFLLEYY